MPIGYCCLCHDDRVHITTLRLLHGNGHDSKMIDLCRLRIWCRGLVQFLTSEKMGATISPMKNESGEYVESLITPRRICSISLNLGVLRVLVGHGIVNVYTCCQIQDGGQRLNWTLFESQ